MRKAVGLILALVAAPAMAAASPSGASGTSGDTAANSTKVVCKEQRVSGTRFPKKKCMKKVQWEVMTEQQRRDADEMLNKPTIGPRGN